MIRYALMSEVVEVLNAINEQVAHMERDDKGNEIYTAPFGKITLNIDPRKGTVSARCKLWLAIERKL